MLYRGTTCILLSVPSVAFILVEFRIIDEGGRQIELDNQIAGKMRVSWMFIACSLYRSTLSLEMILCKLHLGCYL